MKQNSPSNSVRRAVRRKIDRVTQLLREVCDITGRDEISVIVEISRAQPRPPAPPSTNHSMSVAKFRELGLDQFDRLIIATCFPLDPWIRPGEDLTYATIGSGENEVFISPPRLLSTILKPKNS